MNRRRPAFTLIELLTVIAILGLLISILIPSLSAARRAAKANVCLSHLKGIGNSFVVYLNENEDIFPPFQMIYSTPTLDDADYINEHGRIAPRWQWFLETDLGPVINPTPFQSSIDSSGFFSEQTRDPTSGQPAMTMGHDLFTCPSLDDEEFERHIRDGAFGYNYQYLGNTRRDADPQRWDNFPVGLHMIRSTGSTILVADSRGAARRRHGPHSFTLDPPRMAVEVRAADFEVHNSQYIPVDFDDFDPDLDLDLYAYSPMEPRHNDLGNVLFVDSHAEAMTLKALGYEMDNANNTPIPIREPQNATYCASNKLWSGDGSDLLAHKHRPANCP